ncbi:MAG: hypothetical protein IT345_08965 [Trueperaceae bacterium]|nr:hypothetical protein [Trueperaceae bacterium]
MSTTSRPAAEAGGAAARTVAGPVAGATTLTVSGPDATGFLQGQLANDVAGLPVGGARRSLYLNHKGHALAEAMVVRLARDEYVLVEEGGAAAWMKAEFERHVIFDDVRVVGPTPVRLVTLLAAPVEVGGVGAALGDGVDVVFSRAFGVDAPAAERVVTLAGGFAYPSGRSALGGYDVVSRMDQDDLPVLSEAGAALATPSELTRIRVRACAALAPQDAGEGVLPQEAGLEGALSYRKGCYLGQEIMARIEARGNVRRALAHVRLAGDPRPRGEPPGPDGEAWRELRAGGRTVGRLGTVVEAEDGGFEALAVMRSDVAEATPVTTASGIAVRRL